MPPVITLLTDFGNRDGFVGIVKGVILQRAPGAVLVDLSHDIPPQDIRAAALVLRSAVPYFPSGTIHLAVVDPGVGTSRRALCIVTQEAFFIGPDNGVLTFAAPPSQRLAVYSLEREEWFLKPTSRTFHGRDVFAPVAGLLAAGTPASALGPRVGEIVELPWPMPLRGGNEILGEVLYVDRFGNLITNLGVSDFTDFSSECVWINVAGRRIRGIVPTYSHLAPGEIGALFSSWGLLEIAQREGDAARELGVGIGARVTVTLDRKGS